MVESMERKGILGGVLFTGSGSDTRIHGNEIMD